MKGAPGRERRSPGRRPAPPAPATQAPATQAPATRAPSMQAPSTSSTQAGPDRHRSRAFALVYRDDDIVVVDKAPGVLTVPSPRRERFTLVDEVSRLLSKGPRITREAFVVHRLDRETSGIVVFACHRDARDRLVAAWADHERVYATLVHGVVRDDEATIRSRLVTDRRSLQRRSTGRDDVGEDALTFVRVDERLVDATLLSVRLGTGRRNQIRVHLAEAGHPVLGDERYGGSDRHPRWDDRRLGLHARLLAFAHPRTGAPLSFDTGLPVAFSRFVAATHATTSPSGTQARAGNGAMPAHGRGRSERPDNRPRRSR
jgi:23S rRNA pseudouridine1911/1915/1917 synthase